MVTYTEPKHAKEHEELMKLLAKAVEKSKDLSVMILITIGHDGRPCVGGNAGPEQLTEIFRRLGEASDLIVDVVEVITPSSN